MFATRFGRILLLVAVLLLGGAWTVLSQVPAQRVISTTAEAPLPGYAAPDFTLTTTTGETIQLAETRGQPVVVNFWATWCGPCRAEMPDFQRASERLAGQALILGVNQRETAAQVTEFALKLTIDYPLLLDTTGDINQLYRVRAIPTTVFIDENGIIDEVYTGVMTQAVLEQKLAALLAE
ncbi:MAG: TlpA family protein disulfide reductase [Anaerolineales bacterium]|nr:TlpA family protein disulfide reductase [Anaerolineales bacterium]